MVLADTDNSLYTERRESRGSSRSEVNDRLLDVEFSMLKMEEQEQSFFRKRSLPDIRVPKVTSGLPKRTITPPDKTSLTIMNPKVPFTSRNSAISKNYTSPRQFTLSASATHMSRQESARTDREWINSPSTQSMDYDEYEDIPLEQLKFHKPAPQRVTRSEDIYRKACSKCGVTPSQAYLNQISKNRTICMANTSLSHRTLKPIAISLVRDNFVTSLDISGNDVGALGIIYISEMLVANDTIHLINLSSTNPRREGLAALAQALEKNKCLNVLKLESNYLDHRETEFIVQIMQCAPNLSEIYLGHNDLGYESAKLLARELEVNSTVHHLDLQWNHFRKESAKLLCKALKVNTGLRSLNCSWNGIGKEGCIALAHSLPKNKCLRDLDLTNNRIDIVALPFLLHGLVRNTSLRTLKVGKNPLTTEGVKAIVRAITGAKKMSLRHLNTEDIPVDKDFTNLVKKMQADRDITIEHGVEMYSAIELVMKEHDPHDLNRFDPVMVLIEYMRIDNLRLIDLFQYFDSTGQGLVSRDNLRTGVATLGLPLTEHHLDCIMKDIDKKRDGYIDLEEFMMAQRDMSKTIIQRTTRAKGKGKEDLGLKELRKILKELVEKRNQRNKEKAVKKLNAFAGAVTKVKVMNDMTKKVTAMNDDSPDTINRENAFMEDSTDTNQKSNAAVKRKSSIASLVAHYTELEKHSTSSLAGVKEEDSLDTHRDNLEFKYDEGQGDGSFASRWPIQEEETSENGEVFSPAIGDSSKLAWATPRLEQTQ